MRSCVSQVAGGVWRSVVLAPVLAVVVLVVCVVPALGAGFGLRGFEMAVVNGDGSQDVQAGSHPYALAMSFSLDESEELGGSGVFVPVDGGLKDVQLQLPPGFVGNPNAVPRCSYHDFLAKACPNDTAVGEATTGLGETTGYVSPRTHRLVDEINYITNPVYNVEPPGGVPDELGILAKGFYPVLVDASVRTGGDYGITAGSSNITEAIVIVSVKLTVWGVPGDPSHDAVRGKCLGEAESSREQAEDGSPHNEEKSECPDPELEGPGALPVEPFLTNPTSCGGAREAELSVDGWNEPGDFVTGENIVSMVAALPPLTGCEKLNFSPSLTVAPDGVAGSTPTGLNVDVHVPQESTTNPVGLGEADMRDTTVTLPEGVQVSPSAADGLQACPLLHGREPVKEEREREGSEVGVDLESGARADCPDASKLATVRVRTPLLEGELEGSMYLAAPQNFVGALENPFGSLIAMYLVVEEPKSGVLVKLAGRVAVNPQTGQLTATFENIPQFPVSEVKLEFFGTDRAPLATPALCGTYTTTTAFTPWSAAEPSSPSEIANPSSSFQIMSGPAGASCVDPLGFAPSLTGGSTNIQAAAFSALTTTISREDGQQDIQTVQLHFPAGVSGILTGVKLCPEAQANAGTCGAESLIGETIVSVGLGNDPYTVAGGKVYITEKYEGAPFGLSIVNPAKAGPFVLQEGRPVVVRGKLELDRHTTALTFTSNTESEGYAIPSIIDGIPLQIKHVYVTINRPGFTFNPTSCNKTQITGSITSATGANAPVSVPYQVTDCAALGFAPKFKVSSAAKTSRTDGASLNVKLAYPTAPFGSQANIAKVAVNLPKQLPSRLKTLQKACTAAQFEADPAGCPPASIVGHAKAITPLLPVPLEGPAYFVSYGGEAFPSLIIVLQGYGVTVDLVGTTFINKHNVTSSTFKTVPDQPVTAFELNLPEGPYSALTTEEKTSLCKSKLVMPTVFVAQNGTERHQNTKIAVTGCPKKKTKLTRKTKPTNKTSKGSKKRK